MHTYDGNSNILSVSGSENVTYTYDSRNRLTSSQRNGTTITYTYDKRNNLIEEVHTRNEKTIKSIQYTYSGDNRLESKTENGTTISYKYDLNGNLTGDSEGNLYRHASNDCLIYSKVDGVETTYTIGLDGYRSSKTTGNTTINGTYYYYVYNAHGDVIALIDNYGRIRNEYTYNDWGAPEVKQKKLENPILYAGEYYDDETGQIYLRARYYQPKLRRFTQEDQARDELNWYSYCENTPINYVDRTGESAAFALKYWATKGWVLVGVDGPIPIGDAVYIGVGVVLTIGAAIEKYGKKATKKRVISQNQSKIAEHQSDTKVSKKKESGDKTKQGSSENKNRNKKEKKPKKKSKTSGKEKASDTPSWSKGEKPRPGESGKEFATRLMDERYGKGNYNARKSRQYSQLKKYGDRGGK